MPMFHLPPAIEVNRLLRLREAILGGKQKRHSSIGATDDWIAEIDARLAVPERAILPSFRVNS